MTIKTNFAFNFKNTISSFPPKRKVWICCMISWRFLFNNTTKHWFWISIEARSKVYYRLTVLFFWKMIQTHISKVLLKSIFYIVAKLLLLRILVNILSTLIFPPHNGRAKRHSGNNFALLHWNAVKHVWNVFSEINETKDISLRCLLKFEDCFTYCMNNTSWTLGWLIHLYLHF